MIRRVLALVWLNILQMLRSPAELVGVIVLPIALSLLFGSALGGGVATALTVLFVDEDQTTYSAQVGSLIDAQESFETSAVTRAEAERLIAAGNASAAVIVPAGFADGLKDASASGDTTGTATIEVLRNPTSENALAVQSVVAGIAMRMSGDAEIAAIALQMVPSGALAFADVYDLADSQWEPEPPVSAEGEIVVASSVRGDSVIASGGTSSSIGFTVWFILFTTFGGAGGILEEREQGTLRRLLMAPTGRGTIMAGKVLGVVATAAVQALILVLVGAFLFHVPWGNNPLAVFMVLGSYVLAGTGLAVLVSALVRTRGQLSGAAPIISTGLAMLGGCLWPIEILSPVMKFVANCTPTGWAVAGLTDIVARNQGIASAVLPTVVLLAFAAVSLGIGVKLLKFE